MIKFANPSSETLKVWSCLVVWCICIDVEKCMHKRVVYVYWQYSKRKKICNEDTYIVPSPFEPTSNHIDFSSVACSIQAQPATPILPEGKCRPFQGLSWFEIARLWILYRGLLVWYWWGFRNEAVMKWRWGHIRSFVACKIGEADSTFRHTRYAPSTESCRMCSNMSVFKTAHPPEYTEKR